MKNKFELIFSKTWFLICPGIVSVMLLAIYLIKGIYPFGSNTISYFDMAQSIVPIYYYTYDFLHGNADCFLNWNVSLGSSMGDLFGNFIFFPTNVFFFFVKRENIIYSMSFFLIFKLALSSLFMSIYSYSKVTKKVLAIFAGIAYSSCGFVIQYYTNIYFLDCFLIFPLLILGYDLLIEKNKKVLYIICLSLAMICNVQMIFFVCFYLFLKTFFTLFDLNKEDKGKVVCRILFCSLCSFLCGCFSFIPMAIQTLKSSRVGSNMDGGYFANIQTVLCDYQQHKNFMLYGVEFVFAIIITIIVCRKIKTYKNILLLITLLMIPIVFEGVNLVWHLGTYQMFPFRFGFILTFECLNLLLNSYDDIENCEIKIGKYFGYLSIGLIPMLAIVLFNFMKYFKILGIRDLQIYLSYWIIFAVLILLYFGIFVGVSSKLKPYMLVLVILIQASLGFYGLIGVDLCYVPECEPDIIYNSEKVKKETNDLLPLIDRTKDANLFLNANYSFITSKASGSGWVNGTTSELVSEMKRMGYDRFYIRTLDCGGTALTDSFLGYKYYINNLEEYNNDLYTDIDGKKYLYKCKYIIPFGVIVNDNSFESDSKVFDYQNDLYNFFLGNKDDLFDDLFIEIDLDTISGVYNDEKSEYDFSFDLIVPDRSILYVYASPSKKDTCEIYINENPMTNAYFYSEKNSAFPTYYRNGFWELGSLEGENNITIKSQVDSLDGLQLGLMSLDKYSDFIEKINATYQINSFEVNKNELKISILSDIDGVYILPLGYSDNWKVECDGYLLSPKKSINDSFLAVNIHKGENNIILEYNQKGFITGLILSIIGVLLAIIVIKFDFYENLLVNKIVLRVYYFTFAIAIIYVYVTPISCNILKMIMDKLTILDILNYF